MVVVVDVVVGFVFVVVVVVSTYHGGIGAGGANKRRVGGIERSGGKE